MRVSRLSVIGVAALVGSLLSPVAPALADPPAAPAAPVAAISSPTDGASVTNPLTVNASGTLDPSAGDTASQLILSVDGVQDLATAVDCTTQTDQNNCVGTFTVDPTSWRAGSTHTLEVEFDTAAEGFVNSPVTTVVVPPPVVSFTPLASPVTGQVNIGVTGSTDAATSDSPASLQLDWGSTTIGSTSCPPGHTCSATFPWDTTLLTDATHDLVATMTTTSGVPATPATESGLAIHNPPPVVTITSPADNATGSGIITVTATGTVPPGENDHPQSMQLYVGDTGNPVNGQKVFCDQTQASCDGTFTWDATGKNGTFRLIVGFNTTRHRTDSDSIDVRVTTRPPTASIASPVNGATVSGVVSVVTGGAINLQQNDTPKNMQLLVDGVALSGAQPCLGTPTAPKSCSLPFSWDTTGLSGQHTLQAKFGTAKGFSALSPVTTVTVVSPLPRASIVSPAINATLHRTATITVNGAVDPSQTDTPATVQLTLDGAPLGSPLPCPPATAGARTCSTSYTWNTLGLVGRHLLAATLTTAKGRQGTSSLAPVYVYGGTKTSLTAVKTQHYGKSVRVTGRVTALVNKSAVAGVKVKVRLLPVSGHAKTLYVRTNARGFFSVAFKPALNTVVQATVVPPSYYGTSHTFTKVKVKPRATCTVGRTVRHNRLDTGSCKIPNLVKGTKLTLQYALKGHWYTIGSGLSHSTIVPFSFRLAAPGKYLIRVVLGASKAFVASTTPSLKVTVT